MLYTIVAISVTNVKCCTYITAGEKEDEINLFYLKNIYIS